MTSKNIIVTRKHSLDIFMPSFGSPIFGIMLLWRAITTTPSAATATTTSISA